MSQENVALSRAYLDEVVRGASREVLDPEATVSKLGRGHA